MLVNIFSKRDNKTYTYHVDNRLIKFLEKVKQRINKKDKDYVLLIDGYEGAGKSTFGIQMGRYVDNDLSLDQICMTATEFKQAIINAKKGQCILYDEAVTGLTAGDSISRVGKLLKSMMMQMRQKNLFVIVVLPTIFELSRYAALSRAQGLFHVYEKGGKMGYWVGYNRKDTRQLYLKGKKNHAYCIRSFFIGRFYGKYAIEEDSYRKKKADTLFLLDTEDKDMLPTNRRMTEQRNFLIYLIHIQGKTYEAIAKEFKKCRFPVERSQIGEICRQIEDLYGDLSVFYKKSKEKAKKQAFNTAK